MSPTETLCLFIFALALVCVMIAGAYLLGRSDGRETERRRIGADVDHDTDRQAFDSSTAGTPAVTAAAAVAAMTAANGKVKPNLGPGPVIR